MDKKQNVQTTESQTRTIQLAANPSELASIVTNLGLTPGLQLSSVIKELKSRKSTRTMLALATTVLMLISATLSYQGAGVLWTYGRIATVAFALLDLVLLGLIYFDKASGTKAAIILLFEALTIFYFGYTIGGFFGRGSLTKVANERMSEAYEKAGSTYAADAATLTNMAEAAKSDAVKIQKLEIDHDGVEGIVWQKAKLLADMKVGAVPTLSAPPAAPAFTNAPEANKWLQQNVLMLSKEYQKCQSTSMSLIQQAKSAEAGVKAAMSDKLTPNQASNMASMQTAMKQIGDYELKTPEIKVATIEPGDLHTEDSEKAFGFLIAGLTVIFLSMLSFLFKLPAVTMDDLRKEALDALSKKGLTDLGIHYDGVLNPATNNALKSIKAAMNNEENDAFKKYVQNAPDFDAVVDFVAKYPDLLTILPQAHANKWKFTDIAKLLENNPDAEMYLEYILLVPRNKWNDVSTVVTPLSKAVGVVKSPVALKKFTEIVDTLKRKLGIAKLGDLEREVSKLIIEDASDEYMEKLALVCEKLSKKELSTIERSFVEALSTGTVLTMIAQADTPEFANIVRDWTVEDNDKLVEILSNGVSKEPAFELLSEVVFVNGVTGFRKMANCYTEQTKLAKQTGMGAKVTISATAMDSVKTARAGQDKAAFYTALSQVFEVK